MKREEFVARMLADQELRRERRKKARYKANEDIRAIQSRKQASYLRHVKKRRNK